MESLNNKENVLYVAGIIEESIVDGPGVRFVIFLQGCDRHCKNCHNPETWDHSSSILEQKKMTFDKIYERLSKCKLCKSITFSGGEPFLQADAICRFIGYLNSKNKKYNLMSFTGYTVEELLQDSEDKKELLYKLDYLIDGAYIDELRTLELKYRGSSNQKFYKIENNSIMLIN